MKTAVRNPVVWITKPIWIAALGAAILAWAGVQGMSDVRADETDDSAPRISVRIGSLVPLTGEPIRSYHVPTRVYSIHSSNADWNMNCSATLLRLREQCVLVTNAHCLVRGTDSVELSGADRNQALSEAPEWKSQFAALPPGSGGPLTVKVLKADRELDLAQLEIPPQLESVCADLRVTKVENPRERVNSRVVQSLASLGYLRGVPKVLYVGDHSWISGYASTVLSLYPLSPDPKAVMIQYRNATLIPGMSGGPSISYDFEVIGINARYIPFQSTLYVIPLDTVWYFLQRRPGDESKAAVQNLPHDAGYLQRNSSSSSGSSTHRGTGGGSHADGGGGSHADGGGGSHADGGGSDVRYRNRNPLASFREPLEGVPDSRRAGAVLLGVGGEQIDGTDDYAIKVLTIPEEQIVRAKIFRETDGYPAEKIRKRILTRLNGYYRTDRLMFAMQGPDEHQSIYIEDAQSPTGWMLGMRGIESTEVELNEDGRTLTFDFAEHSISAPEDVLQIHGLRIGSRKLVFKIEPSPDHRVMTLTLENTPKIKLTCENQNYLKLICVGPELELSISLNSLKERHLTYRFAQLLRLNDGRRAVDFHYGWVKGQKKFR